MFRDDMKWFKHSTGSHDDPDIADGEDLFGDAAYTVFFKTLEVYGEEYNHLADGWLDISKTFLRRKLKKSWAKVEQVLNFYKEKNRIIFTTTPDRISLKVPKFIEIASNWTIRENPSPTEAPTEAPTAIEVEEEVEKKKKRKEEKKYIVEYLNSVCGTNFKFGIKETERLISARMNNGFTVADFESVINHKHAQWKDSADMKQYLRPITLFGTKFEAYLSSSKNNKPDEEDDGYR